ncbi:MAG: DUF3999 family protein [Terracidiphilus sp.]
MKLRFCIALIAAVAAAPQIGYFRYQRPIVNNPPAAGQTCLALDPQVFVHASPELADLRLYRDGTETPYAIHRAAPAESAQKSIAPLNLGKRGGQTVFDAPMPDGNYADVQLAVDAHNFIATVTVAGSQVESGGETKLGSYTIFDLTRQKLGRSTVLHLPNSDFHYLYFRIAGPIQPESVTGLSVERLPAGRPKYVTVAESARIAQQGRKSVVEFTVPANVPVDRIVFVPGAEPVNFSRDVSVATTPIAQRPASDAEPPEPSPSSFGNLLRVHSVQDGHRIEEERLSIEALGTELDTPAKWKIEIENGDDRPIQLQSVRLEMIERDLCFDASANAGFTLYYGDPALQAPRYDYARLFAFEATAAQATLGPEQQNAEYRPRPDQRPFTEKHLALLWVALIAVILLLGAIALKSAKRSPVAS